MNTPMARNSSNAATSTIKLRSSIDVLPSRLNGVPLLRSVVVMHVGAADALSLLVQDPKVNDVRRYARFLHQRWAKAAAWLSGIGIIVGAIISFLAR